jgi:hypothetical protein
MGLFSFIKGLFSASEEEIGEDISKIEFAVNKSIESKRGEIDVLCSDFEDDFARLQTSMEFLKEGSDEFSEIVKSMEKKSDEMETNFLNNTEILHNEIIEIQDEFEDIKKSIHSKNENVDRKQMPQLGDWVDCYDLMWFFMDHGIVCNPEKIKVQDITYANKINVEKVAGIVNSDMDLSKAKYFLSNDGIALDGNHRLAATAVKHGKGHELNVFRCEEGLDQLIDCLHEHGKDLLRSSEDDKGNTVSAPQPVKKAVMTQEEFQHHVKVISDNKDSMDPEVLKLAIEKIRTLAATMGYQLAA